MLRVALAAALASVATAQKATDACAAAPCQNGGVCTAMGTSYVCMCQAEYLGANCERSTMEHMPGGGGVIGIMPPPPPHPVDPLPDFCASAPCMNGGVCSSMPRGYQCMCSAGFMGENCQSSMGRPMHPVDPLPPAPAPAGTHGGVAGNTVPTDCTSWNDGCNTCGVSNGQVSTRAI